jgi:hypothetical protein
MKDRAIWTLCCEAAVLLCLASFAFAQDSTLTLTSAGDNIMDNIYVGPYTGTIGGNAGQQIICDDFSDESEVGNGWATTANSITMADMGNTLWGQALGASEALGLYQEAAYITYQMLTGNNSQTQIGYMSYAIWYLFDSTAVTSYLGSMTGANSAIWSGLEAVLAAASGKSLSATLLSEFVIYTPLVNGQPCSNPGQCPGQEFMEFVQAPEGGGALAYLLLAGVACFGAMFHTRKQRAKRALA